MLSDLSKFLTPHQFHRPRNCPVRIARLVSPADFRNSTHGSSETSDKVAWRLRFELGLDLSNWSAHELSYPWRGESPALISRPWRTSSLRRHATRDHVDSRLVFVMMVERVDFVQQLYRADPEWRSVLSVADALSEHLQEPTICQAIDEANQPGTSSAMVQNVLLKKAIDLGFRDEAKGLFKDYANKGLRPDYFMPVGASGILLEVERGKTNINNMDFLDFWKCHICSQAHYLFLLVPKELKQNAMSRASKPFNVTTQHMSTFFQPSNYTNVRGLVLFGY